jgi:hypothetical protein
MAIRSRWVEVISGIATFTLALVTWGLLLFAPLFPDPVRHCVHACPQFRFVSQIEIPSDLRPFITVFPGITALILAFLAATAAVAIGACLHGGWRIRGGRWLVWGGSAPLALLTSVMSISPRVDDWVYFFWPFAGVRVVYGPHAPLVQLVFPAGPRFAAGLLIHGLGPGLCAVLAIIASVAAAGGGDGSKVGGISASAMPPTRRGRAARVEVLAGVGAFALALLALALWLLAPVYHLQRDGYACGGSAGPCVYSISPVESSSDLGSFIHYFAIIAALILAFLVASGMVAVGAYLHGGRRVRAGRWLLWGGSLSLPVLVSVVSVISALPLDRFIPWVNSPFPRLYGGWSPDTVTYMAPGPDMLVLGWGPGLCAGLAVIALVAMAAVEARRQPSR